MIKRKSVFFNLCIFSFIVLFSGCSGKNNKELSWAETNTINGFKNIAFNMMCYSEKKTAESEYYSKLYYPEQFKTILNRKHYKNGSMVYLLEDYIPAKTGIIDSSGFYCGAEDNGDWVESAIIAAEEERIADEIHSMEEYIQDESSPEDLLIEEINDQQDENTLEQAADSPEAYVSERALSIERFLNSEAAFEEHLDKSSNLRFMELDNEILIPQIVANGYIVVRSTGEKVTRNFYDILYRLKTKETWKIISAANAELEKTEEYTYKGDSYTVSDKTITTKNTDSLIKYNSEGSVIENTSFIIYEDKKYLSSKVNIEYNSDQKVIEETTVTYSYNDDYSKQKDSFTKRYKYSYHSNEEIPADFEYYEDGVLKLKNTYSETKGTYVAQIFFEADFSVKTFYEDGLRYKDIYYRNNEVVRTKEYER